tara:strand:- start:8761 stop:9066 length:306 start_codon:yes stop_codon:yes gene_type:complete
MRELQAEEVEQVSGGFQGTKIPFANGFIPGESINGKPAGIIGAVMGGWNIGFAIGSSINDFNTNHFNMSLGEAVYRTMNGGSRIPSASGKISIPVVKIEEI